MNQDCFQIEGFNHGVRKRSQTGVRTETAAAVVLVLLLLLAGCATKKLWEDTGAINYQPASPAGVRVLHHQRSGALFVEYSETNSRDGTVQRRWYALDGNEARIKRHAQPALISPADSRVSSAVALSPCPNPASSNKQPCVATGGVGEDVVIWANGVQVMGCRLPVYSRRDTGETLKCVALTPFAVVADTILALPFLVVIAAGEFAESNPGYSRSWEVGPCTRIGINGGCDPIVGFLHRTTPKQAHRSMRGRR